ncbi:MAG TPA: PASTA domain-containing protein [Gemmatimonadaceae bacterium]|nr:PASTA domain-containing protein [Gemmatimonadaceae bacterium]
MSLRTRVRRSLPYAIVIIGGFLAAYLIVAFFIFPSGVIPRDIRVPNVTGLAFDDAVRRLAERGLRGVKGEERFHAASPKGTVLEQTPSAGSRDVEGASVTLAVSVGQQSSKVPVLNGLSRADAERTLEEAGFDIGDVTERPSNTPAGQVIDSRPRGGSEATIPSAVSLVVSAGPTVVLVPGVIGQSVAQARQLLENAGLMIGDIRAPSGDLLNDDMAIVSATTPAAGAQVGAGTRVSIQAVPRS